MPLADSNRCTQLPFECGQWPRKVKAGGRSSQPLEHLVLTLEQFRILAVLGNLEHTACTVRRGEQEILVPFAGQGRGPVSSAVTGACYLEGSLDGKRRLLLLGHGVTLAALRPGRNLPALSAPGAEVQNGRHGETPHRQRRHSLPTGGSP